MHRVVYQVRTAAYPEIVTGSGHPNTWPIRLLVRTRDFQSCKTGSIPVWAAMASYWLDRYHARRDKAIQILGGKCALYGAVEDLEIDHIDPASKALDLARQWGVPWGQYAAELAKCQLLCHSCHKRKSDAEQTKTVHGTLAMYNRGACRCPACSLAKRSYMRGYMRKRRGRLSG